MLLLTAFSPLPFAKVFNILCQITSSISFNVAAQTYCYVKEQKMLCIPVASNSNISGHSRLRSNCPSIPV